MRRQGLTLAEVMVTVAIIGIVASASVAYFGVAVQRARYDAAQNILLTIYAGEQVYYALNNPGTPALQRYFPPTPPGPLLGPLSAAAVWRTNIYCDNPNDPASPADRMEYQVTANNVNPATFTATARYFRGGVLVATLRVNELRVFTGTLAWVTRP